MGGSITKVLPGLYVGNVENIYDDEEIIANCITHVLVVKNEDYHVEMSPSLRFFSVIMSAEDQNSLCKHVSNTNDFIHSARTECGGVLVCSDSGLSANITVVAAYLMSIYDLTWMQALAAIGDAKQGIRPVQPLQTQLDVFAIGDQVPNHEPQVTAQSERKRLTEKFGPWPRLDEDLNLLLQAVRSHDTRTDFDLIHRSSELISTPPSNTSLQSARSDSSAPLTPETKSVLTTDPVTVPENSSHFVSESELFPLDPSLINPDHQLTSPASRTVLRDQFGNSDIDEHLEVGFELTGDDTFVNDADDVPGAIPMFPFDGSSVGRTRAASSMARSYHHARSHLPVLEKTTNYHPVARSLAVFTSTNRDRF